MHHSKSLRQRRFWPISETFDIFNILFSSLFLFLLTKISSCLPVIRPVFKLWVYIQIQLIVVFPKFELLDGLLELFNHIFLNFGSFDFRFYLFKKDHTVSFCCASCALLACHSIPFESCIVIWFVLLTRNRVKALLKVCKILCDERTEHRIVVLKDTLFARQTFF